MQKNIPSVVFGIFLTFVMFFVYWGGERIYQIRQIQNISLAEVFAACEKGDLEKMKEIIKYNPNIVDEYYQGVSLLAVAVKGNHSEVFDLIHAYTGLEEGLFALALKHKAVDVAVKIADHVDANTEAVVDEHEGKAFHWAARNCSVDLANVLMGTHLSVNEKNGRGETPLNIALQLEHQEMIDFFIDKSASIEVRDFEVALEKKMWVTVARLAGLFSGYGKLPLELEKHPSFVDEFPLHLFAKLKNVNFKADSKGNTLLHLFMQRLTDVKYNEKRERYLYLAQQTILTHYKPTVVNNDGYTPLHLAAIADESYLANLLLVNGEKIREDKKRKTPAHYARSVSFLSTLKSCGVDILAGDSLGRSALFHAAGTSLDVVQFLVAQGAVVQEDPTNYRFTTKYRPIYHSLRNNKNKITNFLLNSGVKLLDEREDKSLIHQAIEDDQAHVVQSLIEVHGYPVNHTDSKQRTGLHYAAKYGNKEIVSMVLRNLDTKHKLSQDHYGKTALHYAIARGDLDILGLLISSDDVNQQGKWGFTLLHEAASTGQVTSVQFLLDHEANLQAQDGYGATPIDYALNEEVKSLLQEKGGQSGGISLPQMLGVVEKHFSEIWTAFREKDEQKSTDLIDLMVHPSLEDEYGKVFERAVADKFLSQHFRNIRGTQEEDLQEIIEQTFSLVKEDARLSVSLFDFPGNFEKNSGGVYPIPPKEIQEMMFAMEKPMLIFFVQVGSYRIPYLFSSVDGKVVAWMRVR